MEITCKNCAHVFFGKHCNGCGQQAATHRLDTHEIWHDIQHGLLHFDRGIFFTIKQMFTRPGHSIREYIEGKRVQHFKPLSFVLLVAGLYGYLLHVSGVKNVDFHADNKNKLINAESIYQWLQAHYGFVTLATVVIAAWASQWAFRKIGYNYIENLILNAFLSGQHLLIALVFIPLMLWLKGNPYQSYTELIPSVIAIATTFWTYKQFYNTLSSKEKFWRTVLSYGFSILIYIVVIIILGIIAALVGYFSKHH
jgi:Protein of unknown function (DUF3667)